MSFDRADALVSTDWLADNAAGVRIVDGSWHLPTLKRDPIAEYAEGHIPGAVYFDIDRIADRSVDLPHMFPDAGLFADAVGALGIANDDHVVVYDNGRMMAACRVWWMFRAFGHAKVSVLDGGGVRWRAENRPWTAELPAPAPTGYRAALDPGMLRSVDQVLGLVGAGGELILDARAEGRFFGRDPEPRAGLRSGHMPGAANLPYDDLLGEDGRLKPVPDLAKRFAEAGLDARPVVTSCGSGVSAAVLLLALHLMGRDDTALYDGSWSEWGSRPDTPIVTD